jgi:hypothetical protein
MKKKIFIAIVGISFASALNAQTASIQIDANSGQKAISPNIYGRNNSLSDNPSNPTSAANWQLYKEAGVRFFRENGGNNATKYNWRLKIGSHPDWYNNVYSHDWDFAAQSLQNNIPNSSCLWAFQLIGKAAANKNNNFNDWSYNQAKWWSGVTQNLAGGGVVNTGGGSTASQNGNPELYLMNWTADSTVGIVNHWFGTNGLGLDKNIFNYWNMDNEAEIWSGTHDDVMPSQITAEQFMQRYFEVAKKARAAFPEIKLVGPVTANEWQWYVWNNATIAYGGKIYSWLEYFIKRIAEEQIASGIKLLDVLDIHFYPDLSDVNDFVQVHRVFYDKAYDYPGANGVKKINGGWDNTITKEYIFERCNEWLTTHIGANHGITLGLTEIDLPSSATPMVTAVWYASMLGTFADHGVEIFTPWSWRIGMWETLHLFSRYNHSKRVQSVSNTEQFVSAYSSINASNDSMTVFLVNRSASQTYSTTVSLQNFAINNSNYNTHVLKNLGTSETFVSHTQNALQTGSVYVANNTFNISLPPYSVTAVILSKNTPTFVNAIEKRNTNEFYVQYSNSKVITIVYKPSKKSNVQIELIDMNGRKINTLENSLIPSGVYTKPLDFSNFNSGIYILRYKTGYTTEQCKVVFE